MTTTTIDERAQQEAEEERLEYQLLLLTKVWRMESYEYPDLVGTATALAAELGILEAWNKELERLYGQK